MKRSPYFFQRLQAEKKLQTYLSTSFFLFLFAIGVTTYAWQTPNDDTPRMAILNNSKPVPEKSEPQEILQASDLLELSKEDAPTTFQLESADNSGAVVAVADQPFGPSLPVLPEEFNSIEPTAELNDSTSLGSINFSTEVTDNYDPIDPQEIFPEGFYRLYATFTYEGLKDGMVWSWVWQHNGDVVEGGHERWTYGEEGPGYIYFEPDEGFDTGLYTLNVWVNGELMTQSSVIMNNATISANN